MFGDGDDAGHCSNGAWNYVVASAKDRATFRLWIRGVIVFYVGVLTICGAAVIASHNHAANLYAQAGSPEANNNSAATRPPATAKNASW